MLGRDTLALVVLAVLAAAACNTAPFTESNPPDCSKVDCTCEQDPTQPQCRGLPGLPEGGIGPTDGGAPVLEDAGAVDAAAEDAEADGGDDDAAADAG
jgi:hypothetical protein